VKYEYRVKRLKGFRWEQYFINAGLIAWGSRAQASVYWRSAAHTMARFIRARADLFNTDARIVVVRSKVKP
jgi:hypothetical protein